MSGMKNLANAIVNDPSFAKQAGMTKAEAAQFVSETPKTSTMPRGVKSTAPKPRNY